MGREADTIHNGPGAVAGLHALIAELRDNARVRLHLRDGSTMEGVVAVVPTIQTFVDGGGDEGLNGVVKLTDNARPEWSATVSLDTIARVEHLDSVAYGTSQS